MGATLTVEDIWPLVNKLPPEERTRLISRLLVFGEAWSNAELNDLHDWSRLTDPADASLLDPDEGLPLSWDGSRGWDSPSR